MKEKKENIMLELLVALNEGAKIKEQEFENLEEFFKHFQNIFNEYVNNALNNSLEDEKRENGFLLAGVVATFGFSKMNDLIERRCKELGLD